MLDKLLAWNHAAARILVWIGGAGLIFAAVMVTLDIIVRDLFDMTLGGADEISGYIFAVSTAFAFPYALLHRTNVRIDALYILFPAWLRSVLDVVSLVALAIFVFPLTWWAYMMLSDSIALGTRSITPLRTPVAIPQSLWFSGLVLLSLTILLVILIAVRRLARRDYDGVHRVAGALTLEESGEDDGPVSGPTG